MNSEGRPGVFATTINVLPGTHHIRFLVDNHMETSRDLPTTVDFGNNLVNYIEVAPQSTPPKGQPIAAVSATAAAAAAAAAAAGGKSVAGAQTTQEPPALSTAKLLGADSSVELTNRAPKWKDVPQPSVFSNELPKYLVDYDQPDESPDFASAAAATEILPMPPSLPGFLGKPILNAATLIKDDNSVLNMPNHTILNHLATSSIKNNILAVSATTRYKDKVRFIRRFPVPLHLILTSLSSLSQSSSTSQREAMTSGDFSGKFSASFLSCYNIFLFWVRLRGGPYPDNI